jgi:aldehyde:ferredoxin oxidoreductase
MMIGGTHGKILHVDLSSQKHRVEEMEPDFYRLLVGGRALTAFFLLRDTPPGVDPLGPENLLIFAPGILQGSNLPGSGRHGIGAKSPLTGAIASTEVGGWWGHEFKRTGYDALVIRGQAEKPIYLWIKDQAIEFRDARHLWGQLTYPTEVTIRQELEDDRVRVAQVGPAGENQVRYAAVMHDVNRAAGRNGTGAVMGAKNLKAVAVRGTQRLPIANRKGMTEVARWFGQNYKDLMSWAVKDIGQGTQGSLTTLAHTGGLPTKNFSQPIFENAELLSGDRNYEMLLKERDTCQACPVECKQVFEYEDENPYRKLRPEYGGPEYEAMGAFGPVCLVDDNVAVAKANELSNANGLDAISTGMSIGFVMECFEHGVISAEDTGGLEFRWGDADLLVRAVEMIANREGFGDVMAEGVARMSERFGPESAAFNITVKGQELPMHEPRLKAALGVGYAVAPVGADHMMNIHDTGYTNSGRGLDRVNSALPEDQQIEPLSNKVLNEDKLRLMHTEVNWSHFQDCALTCMFYPYDYAQLAQVLSAITGVEYTIQDILAVGARAQTLSRLFNYREGFTVEDDTLPKRVRSAFAEGPLEGTEITDDDFAWAKRRFYELMDWEPDTGAPTKSCLEDLELEAFLEKTRLD